jgi:pimeloyl-ACP methyl ester carboxylesterase
MPPATPAPVNGVEIDWAESGPSQGPPLLLIRGLGTQHVQWPRELLDALALRGLRSIRFDNRDVGLSSKLDHAGTPDPGELIASLLRGETPKAPYTLDDMALDTVGLLDALGVESAHVAGISMGGMIAQLIAAKHPARVRSLISIMSSSGDPALPRGTPEAMAALTSTPDDPNDRESVVSHAVGVARLLSSPACPPDDAALRRVAELCHDRCHSPQGVARQMAAVLASGSRVALLEKIGVPTLVIHGAADPLIPIEAGRDTARRVPGAELLEVPGMAHDVAPGLAPLLASAIAEFAWRAERD